MEVEGTVTPVEHEHDSEFDDPEFERPEWMQGAPAEPEGAPQAEPKARA